ncbi:Tn3 family transposase [Clostridium gasigenes]|uniref:Tn3 family transposase n=1 Tax=Clostridium gasigenes TaxID=94869 RepID=UPI001A91A5DA|nr:Tn3 family transposase [Clostridium gasigenes]QSW21480.1 Tn3 family transposase [Clostridium gasigenes]
MNDTITTYLSWIKSAPLNPSSKTFKEIIERINYIKSLQINIDIKLIHPNKLRYLSRLGYKYDAYALRRFEEIKRYSILVVFLTDLNGELIDQAIQVHSKLMISLHSKGLKLRDELNVKSSKSANEIMQLHVKLVKAIDTALSEKKDISKELENLGKWEIFKEYAYSAEKIIRPLNNDYLDLLDSSFGNLRKYSPILFKNLEFHPSNNSTALINAVNVIKDMNDNNKRKIPDDAPIEFISKRWKNHVCNEDGTINKRYYEMAVLTELNNAIHSGDIWISDSKRHKNINEYLISDEDWKSSCLKNEAGISVSLSIDEYLKERQETLLDKLQYVSKNVKNLEDVSIDGGKISLKRLEKNVSEESEKFNSMIYGMIPKISLPELLLEVSEWTHFEQHLTHATDKPPKNDEIPILMAAIMALGTNIGVQKMADSTSYITYAQMANISEWRLHDDALKKAQATLVNYQHHLDLSQYFGDGTTSSSDGMRVEVGVSSIYADKNPHYGIGKGLTMYRHVSNQYSAYSIDVITTNSRNSLYLLDGILGHESELQIEEHYTDTAGYTDQVFGLFHLFGIRFAPRIRDLSECVLFLFNDTEEFYKTIKDIVKGRINVKSITDDYESVLKLAHSIFIGKVSASLILEKLGSYSRKNSMAKALREMGKIEKTMFILEYISDKNFRRRIQRGLNKGEAMNALARAIFFGKFGEFRRRALQEQLQSASALNIIINAITIWNCVYLNKAIDHLKCNSGFDESLLNNISPLGWKHINFLGEYKFNLNQNGNLKELNL